MAMFSDWLLVLLPNTEFLADSIAQIEHYQGKQFCHRYPTWELNLSLWCEGVLLFKIQIRSQMDFSKDSWLYSTENYFG